MKINYNGNIISEIDPILTIHNRAVYGDSVFDLCNSYQKLIFWEEHYLRLMAVHFAYEYPDELLRGIP